MGGLADGEVRIDEKNSRDGKGDPVKEKIALRAAR